MAESSGRAASIASSLPPAIIASSPVTARALPPETGASTKSRPRSAARPASATVMDGSDELMSMISVPAASRPSKPGPAGPSSMIALMTSLLGTIKMTTPTSPATVARSVTAVPPTSAARSAARSETTLFRCRRAPCFARFRAIGAPMLPKPMNRTLDVCVLNRDSPLKGF